LAEADLIVPVPLHRRRLWQRRFNQAAVLAQHISQQCGVAWRGDVLLRTSSTASQVGLTAEERRSNVRHAFNVPPDVQSFVGGKCVVLVDDVRTTGATAEACAIALQKAGAARVYVLTFALVSQPLELHIDA
jgi:ComF family protein